MFMKPTAIKDIPLNENDYYYEEKYDGMRVMLFFSNGKISIINENDKEVGYKYPEIVENLFLNPKINKITLDGELCCLDEYGKSDFNRLLMRNVEDNIRINILRNKIPATLMVFDVLNVNDIDVSNWEIEKRKTLLELSVNKNEFVKVVYYSDKPNWDFITENQREGLVLKRKNSPYIPKRSKLWLKLKYWKDTIGDFDKYEIHTDNNGITLSNGFIRLSVNGAEEMREILDEFLKFGKARIEYTYLRENPSGKHFQLHFKRLIKQGGKI